MEGESDLDRRAFLLGTTAGAAVLSLTGNAAAAVGADLADLSALEAIAALEAREFSALEYADALLERSQKLEALNAFIAQDGDRVRADARAADQRIAAGEVGALHGLPVVLKDNIDTATLPTTAGTPALHAWVPPSEAPVVRRLRAADGVVFGKANMHELAFGITSNNAAFGEVHNPYDPAMIPGGSSGGTAAAVAARLAPAGLGSDTGGSVRIPAALCGCVGFRPTLGRYEQTGVIPLSHTRDTIGPMARTVEDVVLLDRLCANVPLESVEVGLQGLRLGVPRSYFYDDLDAELAAVVEDALSRLSGAGAVLIEADLPDIKTLNDKVGFPIVLFEVLRELSDYLYTHNNRTSVLELIAQVAGEAERGLLTSLLGEGAIPAATYRDALVVHRPALQAAYERYFKDNDVAALVVPTTPLAARPIGEDQNIELNGRAVPTFLTYIRNTDPPSNAGLPCLSVPAGLTASGLPVGIELVGPAMTDARLLAIGVALEALQPPLPAPEV